MGATVIRDGARGAGGGGITNGADADAVMKSDGTNAVASTITDDGTHATVPSLKANAFWLGPMAMTATSIGPGQIDDWNPGTDNTLISLDVDGGGATLTGMVPMAAGRGSIRILETGTSSGPLTITDLDPASSAANQIITPDRRPMIVPPQSAVILHALNDGAHGWRVVAWATTRFSRVQTKTFQLSDPLTPASLGNGTTTHDWDLDLAQSGGGTVDGNADLYSRVNVVTGALGATVTGIYPPRTSSDSANGHVLVLHNNGDGGSATATLTLVNNSLSSTSGMRLLIPGGDITIPLWGSATLIYDPALGFWEVIAISTGANTRTSTGTAQTFAAYTGANSIGNGPLTYSPGTYVQNGTPWFISPEVLAGSTTGACNISENGLYFWWQTNAAATGWINKNGFAGGATQYRNLSIGDGKGNEAAYVDGATKSMRVGGKLQASGASGASWSSTTGSPEGVVEGSPGDLCSDITNGDLYVKKSGSATDTGWKLVTLAP